MDGVVVLKQSTTTDHRRFIIHIFLLNVVKKIDKPILNCALLVYFKAILHSVHEKHVGGATLCCIFQGLNKELIGNTLHQQSGKQGT